LAEKGQFAALAQHGWAATREYDIVKVAKIFAQAHGVHPFDVPEGIPNLA
jgi:hypothetical protein